MVAPEFQNLLKLLQWPLTLTLIYFCINWFQQQGLKPALETVKGKQAKAIRSLYFLAYGSIVFWIALLVLSTSFPGKTSSSGLFFAHIVFSFFLVMSIYLAYSCHTWKILWNRQFIIAPNLWGVMRKVDWQHIESCSSCPSLQVFLLKGSSAPTVMISEYWMGVSTLLKDIEKHHPHITIIKDPHEEDELDDNHNDDEPEKGDSIK